MTAPLFPAALSTAGDVTAGEPPMAPGCAVTAGPADVQTHPPGFATSADRTLCECGCGRFATFGCRFVRHHNLTAARIARAARERQYDHRFIAYYTGAADARNGRPHRGNPGDHTYTRGYNDWLLEHAL